MAREFIRKLQIVLTPSAFLGIVALSIPVTLALQYLLFGEYWSCELHTDTQHLFRLYRPLLAFLDVTGDEL